MSIIALAGEVWIQVRITFPKRVFIGVADTRITIVVCLINGIAATWQSIAVGKVDRSANRTTRCPIATLTGFVAPAAAWVPVPYFTGKFGSQATSQGPQSG